MKKLLLVAAILVGAVSASHAGVNFSIGIGIPLPPPPVIISHRAPEYCPPPVYCPPPRVVYAPACPPPVVVAPRYYHYEPRRYHYEEHWRGNGHRGHYESRGRW